MSSAEGWAAQRLHLPLYWYADVSALSGIGFPISGDATAINDHYSPTKKETRK